MPSHINYPVAACVRSRANDEPPSTGAEICLTDARGYHVVFPQGVFRLPMEQLDHGQAIAAAVNAAYEQGRRDQAEAIRDALQYPGPTI